jgi:hypothetical protein
LTPLAAVVGPAVSVLGALFVVSGLGMQSIHRAMSLFYLVHERLPARHERLIILPLHQGQLLLRQRRLFQPHTALRLGLVYIGQRNGQAGFRLNAALEGAVAAFEVWVSDRWDVLGPTSHQPLLESLPGPVGRAAA